MYVLIILIKLSLAVRRQHKKPCFLAIMQKQISKLIVVAVNTCSIVNLLLSVYQTLIQRMLKVEIGELATTKLYDVYDAAKQHQFS